MTAARLAEKLEVSERTIYRDIADLQGSGVPVEGEAGIGYVLRQGYELPPLMFTRDEIMSLEAGARLIRAWGGASMARAAQEALIKIEAVLPDSLRHRRHEVEVHAFPSGMSDETRQCIDQIERAVNERQRVTLHYEDAQGDQSNRVVRPLGLWFWGKVWTLVAWCELRNDFRMFRIDRINQLSEVPGDRFVIEQGKSLQDFYRLMEERGPQGS